MRKSTALALSASAAYAAALTLLLFSQEVDEMTVFWGLPGALGGAALTFAGLLMAQHPEEYIPNRKTIREAKSNAYLCLGLALGVLIIYLALYVLTSLG